jgi:cytochrome P450
MTKRTAGGESSVRETSDAAAETPVPLGRAFYQDPHEVYRGLRTEGPVRPVTMPDGRPGWLVTSYSDARALLADPRLSKEAREIAKVRPPGMEGVFASPLTQNMLFSDPPDHTRLRRLVNKAFTACATERLRPRIERAADELLDALSGCATFDLVEATHCRCRS